MEDKRAAGTFRLCDVDGGQLLEHGVAVLLEDFKVKYACRTVLAWVP